MIERAACQRRVRGRTAANNDLGSRCDCRFDQLVHPCNRRHIDERTHVTGGIGCWTRLNVAQTLREPLNDFFGDPSLYKNAASRHTKLAREDGCGFFQSGQQNVQVRIVKDDVWESYRQAPGPPASAAERQPEQSADPCGCFP